MICSANQWTGFYMITASVMKELNLWTLNQASVHNDSLSLNPLMPVGISLSAAGLFKYVRPFCYHQALKG